VINAARRASLNEQPKRTSKSPASIHDTQYSSNPQSRRMSFDEPPVSFGHSDPNHHPKLSSSTAARIDYFSDPYTYADLADFK
jgi:hypothetical protein